MAVQCGGAYGRWWCNAVARVRRRRRGGTEGAGAVARGRRMAAAR
jgi:hypothetical protein